MLKKPSEDQYDFITHEWNPIIKDPSPLRKELKDKLFLDLDEVNIDLGIERNIFVCSDISLFLPEISPEWIWALIAYTKKFDNDYLFEGRNTARMLYYSSMAPKRSLFSGVIETNRRYPEQGKHPVFEMRLSGLFALKNMKSEIMVAIDPIMDFDVLEFSSNLISLHPVTVYIGANTGENEIPEPPKEKVLKLIENLENQEIKVCKKKSIERILK